MLHYRLCFLQCDCQRETFLQKVINVNEAQGISQMSPDPLSQVGSGDETTAPGNEANKEGLCRHAPAAKILKLEVAGFLAL